MAAVGRLEPRGGGVGAALAWTVAAAAEAVMGLPAEPLQHRNGDPGQFCTCLYLGLCDSSMCEHQYTSYCPCVRSLMPILCFFSIPRGILLSLRSSIPLSLSKSGCLCNWSTVKVHAHDHTKSSACMHMGIHDHIQPSVCTRAHTPPENTHT